MNMPAATTQRQGAEEAYEQSSARSLTQEEKEAEKVRLQTLVNTFARNAVKGCPCVYFRDNGSERMVTWYKIDKYLENLIVVSPKADEAEKVRCPVAAIQDIYCLQEDDEACFPPEVIATLRPEEKELLLMIVFVSGEFRETICLLEQSPESRDVFLES